MDFPPNLFPGQRLQQPWGLLKAGFWLLESFEVENASGTGLLCALKMGLAPCRERFVFFAPTKRDCSLASGLPCHSSCGARFTQTLLSPLLTYHEESNGLTAAEMYIPKHLSDNGEFQVL